MSTIEELICAALRGEARPWREQGDEEFTSRFITQIAYHGVGPLLHRSLQTVQDQELGWPKAVLDACRNTAVNQSIWELSHQTLLKQVLARLSDIGVRPILFKGTALAYDVYPSPFLRTRGDTDLFIPVDRRDQVCATLEALQFECAFGVKGDLISHTAVYSPIDPAFCQHQLDVHWRISNALVLSKLFSYEELRLEAKELPALSPDALAAGAVHALLIACMHRAGHKQAPYFVNGVEYYGGDRLIWLYDCHLLLSNLTPSQCDHLIEVAAQKGLSEICLEAIEQSCACFASVLPEALCAALVRPGPAGTASRYLNGSVMDQYYANFLEARGIGNKLRFLAQLLFPPESYMRLVYSDVKPNWLPWLYVRRAMLETFKRIQRTIAARERRSSPRDQNPAH